MGALPPKFLAREIKLGGRWSDQFLKHVADLYHESSQATGTAHGATQAAEQRGNQQKGAKS